MTSNRTHITRRIVILSLLFALVCQAVPTLAQTILTSDFEGDSASLPPSWTGLFGGAVWGTEILITDEDAYDGRQSIKIVDTRSDRGIGLRTQFFPISDSGPYRASVYLRNDDTGWGTIYLEFWDVRGTRIAHHIVGGKSRNVWELITAEAAAPEGATHVTLLLYSSGPAVGSVYFDSVTIERVEPSAAPAEVAFTVTRQQIPGESIVPLGEPIQWSQMGSSAQGWDAEGNPTWYYTSPAAGDDRLYAVRIKDGQLLGEYPFPGGGGQSWAMVPLPNGDVYFTAGATLFKFDQQAGRVITLGRPHGNTGMIWDLELDPDGILYGATYPQARIFKLDPANERMVDLGPASSQEYARSLGAAERYIFVGIGPMTDLVAYEKATGEIRSILPDQYKDQNGFVTFVDVRGDRLFVGVPSGSTLVYDVNTLEIVNEVSGLQRPISPVDDEGFVYFRHYSAPYRYQLATDKLGQKGLIQPEASSLGFAEVDPELVPQARRSRFQGMNLVGIQRGQYWVMNQQTGQLLMVPTEIAPTPIRINSMGAMGNTVYGGGITPGGLFVLDTTTGDHTIVEPVGQTDSLVMHDGKIYFGTYTGANLRVYDIATGETKTLGTVGHQQDRPVSMLVHNDRIYVGTVPEYGLWGGALAVLDPSGSVRTYRNVVPDHSVVALAASGDVIYGGTSTLGGLGIDRTPGDGALFAWSTSSNSVLWTEHPLENEPAIGALIMGPDGLLWGAGTHSIFAFDPSSRTLVWQERLKPEGAAAYTWREAFAATYEDYVLLTLNHEYLAIANTADGTVRLAQGNYDRIAVDAHGDLYFSRGAQLFKIPKAVWTAGH